MQAEYWWDTFCKSPVYKKICLAAVQQNGAALKYVKTQTPELCLAAKKKG